MNISNKQLKTLLVNPGFIDENQFNDAENIAQEQNKSINEVLVEKNLIPDENLGQIIAGALGVPFVNLRKKGVSERVLRIVPEIVAKSQKIIAFEQKENNLKLAMVNPQNLEIINLITKKTGCRVIPYYATSFDIKEALGYYKKELKQEFEDIIKENIKKAHGARPEDVPIIRIIDTIFEYAHQNRASDIHIEPQENKVVVRYRIDGFLHDVITFSKDILDLVVTRIKILARLRTDEHRAAQDGEIKRKIKDEKIDIRVSIVPITEGEKVVMRLLSERSQLFFIDELGSSDSDLKKIKINIKKPYGMILATGPTGCGKTTTLYTLLKILNKRELNISTIEDPVEYDIQGINQIQVNPKTNLTFAQGLRAIVRQDPDIIMVGEIRDKETAGIAVNSAMTGHLVLSTLHTNDAATTLPRLLDMKIEPFLVASTVNLIIAQRLVRRICTGCIESYLIEGEKLESLKKQIDLEGILGKKNIEQLRVYQGKGCESCNQTGYSGRVGIFEVLEMNENIKKLVMGKASNDQIKQQAVKEGMTTMFNDGIKKVLGGITTLEEILRATKK